MNCMHKHTDTLTHIYMEVSYGIKSDNIEKN